MSGQFVKASPVRFATMVFDCDGVILDSNRVKTEAFRHVASRFGPEPAKVLVDYHLKNGGISRHAKFRYLFENILSVNYSQAEVDDVCRDYGEKVFSGLLECPIASSLHALRQELPRTRWMVVSGGLQSELRKIFEIRGIDAMFDAGIFGSPDNKDEILARELASENLRAPAVFFGDSAYDHRASRQAGLDFIFINGWTDFAEWKAYCNAAQIPSYGSLSEAVSAVG